MISKCFIQSLKYSSSIISISKKIQVSLSEKLSKNKNAEYFWHLDLHIKYIVSYTKINLLVYELDHTSHVN